ncbi:iron-siderophore ABC transporter substrate-binding protein [Rhodococcus maanshanensis]|uniref:iron-siderophore ABC transporter substrate-binding protein n=1 Tax=Rhodococcus maanshanensis TaxID=183556 RepID=UPI0022B4A35B|nr:iron-siderophore ABC transporter substrate-binding protein [Rhodococcus maanshanensis]MCZ4553985.1 iron-siderophore ABC transporter substrate-binding protein [Rhodococcus maanshanensis]
MRSLFRLGIAALAATTLVGCASDTADSGDAAAGDGTYPVRIENTFGTTTLEARPDRLVTMGWNAQDVLYALGLTPVGQPKYVYGANPNGVMPWAEKYYDADKTTLFDDPQAGEPSIETLAALAPDAILAPYEGFDQAYYDKLSRLAPTVAYPGKAWQTTWQDQTSIIGEAVGKPDEAQGLIDGLGKTLADTGSQHPEFAGKTLAVVNFDTGAGEANVYLPTDPRVQVLTELGFVNAPGVEKLAAANESGKFYQDISLENVHDIDADVIVAFTDGATDPLGSPAIASLGAVQRGSAVLLSDQQVIAGLSNVNVLSVPWVLDKIVPQLSEAAKRAG